MTIQIKVAGTDYGNFSEATVTRSLDSIAGMFTLSAVAANINTNAGAEAFPFRVGDDCQIVVDGNVELTGYIEAVRVDYSDGAHNVVFSGRDRTADIIDSTVSVPNLPDEDGARAASTGGTLLELITNTLLQAGIPNMTVSVPIDLKKELDDNPFKEGEGQGAGIGTSIFRFLESYTRLRQVLMTTDGFGNIRLVRSESGIFRKVGLNNTVRNLAGANNIKKANAKFDASKLFHFYRVSSAGNASQVNTPRVLETDAPLNVGVDEVDEFFANRGVVSDENMTKAYSESEDTTVRPWRIKHIQAEKSANPSDCDARALWENNMAKGRYITYNATVEGHLDPVGEAWQLNAQYPINDEFCNLRGFYLLKAVEWKYDLSRGSETKLTFVLPEAYSNTYAKPPKTRKSGKWFTKL